MFPGQGRYDYYRYDMNENPEGLPKEFVDSGEFPLEIQEVRKLKIVFHFPESYGNATQGLDLSFVACADAVQSTNNPNREFE